jgi:deoxyribonuclease V
MGIASHLGVITGLAAIGCAKSRLTGECEEPAPDKGAWTPCYDKKERIGSLLRTRENVKPVWISPGHRIDHDNALHWVQQTVTRYRLPEPIRAAHRIASAVRKDTGGLPQQ